MFIEDLLVGFSIDPDELRHDFSVTSEVLRGIGVLAADAVNCASRSNGLDPRLLILLLAGRSRSDRPIAAARALGWLLLDAVLAIELRLVLLECVVMSRSDLASL